MRITKFNLFYPQKIKFYENSEQFKLTIIDNNNFKITSSTDLGFQVGEELKN